ncbi:methyltransferase [Allokutzneria sp. A3M-2-11 16]|uniref:methyltransferase n=1 Tax=Allokutzneria sp. A3M-2-11 16 TaxID=2962043 RepID=UPI0020B79036|nr:methyltransferase [Allokutzneria sp. A3M-2-11 16]MCP3803600.1 methyltransferase [Allokutzneria sp. A3M-2-11 16]
MRLVARTLRGIEDVLAEEIGGTVERVGHREVWFRDYLNPLALRTADDVFVVATVAKGIGRTRADLTAFTAAVDLIDLDQTLRDRILCGGKETHTGVDVSASALGKRNYSRFDIEDAVGARLARRLRLPYWARRTGAPPANCLSWRVTVTGDEATIAVRIAERPLHRREYRTTSVPGSLHPPLAAAMIRLAGLRPGDVLFDPCCGAGTIPIEAASVPGVIAVGADIDPRAVAVARSNDPAGRVHWAIADAGRSPLRRPDVIVSNPPWDRQVATRGTLRFSAPRMVLLLPEHIDLGGERRQVSLFGQRPVITVLDR